MAILELLWGSSAFCDCKIIVVWPFNTFKRAPLFGVIAFFALTVSLSVFVSLWKSALLKQQKYVALIWAVLYLPMINAIRP